MGSIKKLWVYLKGLVTRREVQDAGQLAILALEAEYVGKPLAEVNEKQASAAAQLLRELKELDSAAVVCLQQLFMVWTDEGGRKKAICLTLSPKQLIYLRKNPALMETPEALVRALSMEGGGAIRALIPAQDAKKDAEVKSVAKVRGQEAETESGKKGKEGTDSIKPRETDRRKADEKPIADAPPIMFEE